ncbi:hypothetical protein DPMN_031054 [Dreissena polymorpha]|uniref:Uncharacterized protein n=1 Tax=Dreissena polymorpha TaxID=45954 RepID=A0A9D4RIN9_DREPO|nr:hypothetical protein DPMN_031054 [Dreissena polymorpha]
MAALVGKAESKSLKWWPEEYDYQMLRPTLAPLPNPGKVAWEAVKVRGSYASDTNSRYSDPQFLDRIFFLSQEKPVTYFHKSRPYHREDLIGLPYDAMAKTSVKFGRHKEPLPQESQAVITNAYFCCHYLQKYPPYNWEGLIGLPYDAMAKTSVQFGRRKEPMAVSL